MKHILKLKLVLLPILLGAALIYILYLNLFKDRSTEIFGNKTNYTAEEIEKSSAEANIFFDTYFDSLVAQDPAWQSYLGIKTNNDKWTPFTDEFEDQQVAFKTANLKYLTDSIDYHALNKATLISHKLLKGQLELALEGDQYRYHTYPVSQMRGMHTAIPSFLINIHQIADETDAQTYLKRLSTIDERVDQLLAQLKIREGKNIILPKFLFPKILEATQNVMSGFPISREDKPNLLYKDFGKKLAKLEDLNDDTRKQYLKECETYLEQKLYPAYQKLYTYLKKLEKKATDEAGVWKFENGADFYAYKLKQMTSTDLSPEAIHQLGVDEVERIHDEMKAIMKEVSFEGSLQDFFKFMREDQQFYYSNNEAGKTAYLKDANAIIDAMRPKLDELFITKPKAELIVKAVEPFREKSAGKAFYQSPAPDGSRPGTYYVNTYDMAQVPKYQMEALAYHEAIPGHHMQLSIAQELEGLPKFRRYAGRYTAYIEGWGLYSEYIPKEIGFYTDPYSNFGRLAMELWRACRLIVDTGIHFKKWNRQESIDFYKNNTPNSEGDCIKMVDRHIVMPAQATTYKIGMITMLELRDKAKQMLGEKFDIREFHEVLISNGAVPLDVLQDLVEEYVASKQ
ncbi:MAG: DUF885 domain-containing protein [Aureispira sp.]|nr:DUF885 domain-containing protein [Aureispira sp.]